MKKYYCQCGREKSRGAKKCFSCNIENKKISNLRNNNPNWKGGIPKCKCGRFCSRREVKICLKCYIKTFGSINNPFYGKHHTEKVKQEQSSRMKGKVISIKQREQHSNFMKILWKNSNYRKKVLTNTFKSLKLKPNLPEKIINTLLNKILPNQYKYVGNGKIWIERYNPDFININGQKKIVEVYGDYWHNLLEYKIRDKKRLKTYKKYGYKTLILWEHELKNIDNIKEKLLTF